MFLLLLSLTSPVNPAPTLPGCRRKGRHDEELVTRTLGVLAALWERLGRGQQAQHAQQGPAGAQQEELARVAGALAPLAGGLEGREARGALCSALRALGGLLPPLAPAAAELAQLNAMSTTQVGRGWSARTGAVHRGVARRRAERALLVRL